MNWQSATYDAADRVLGWAPERLSAGEQQKLCQGDEKETTAERKY
jgi:hypothetical protein